MSKRFESYFFMILATIVWGAFLPIAKLGFTDSTITPFRYLFYRFLLASIIAIPIIVHYFKKIKHKWQTIRTIILLELIETSFALSLLYIGLDLTSSLETNLIVSSLPIFVILGGIVFLKEKQEKAEWIGLFFAILGTTILIIEPLFGLSGGFSGSLIGNLLVITHNLLTAAYFILAKKHYKKIPKLFVSSISFFVGLLTFAFLSFFESKFNLSLLAQNVATDFGSPIVIATVAYAAIFGSIVGLTSYIKGQSGIEASEASLFTYLEPVIYIPLGYILLKESVTPMQVISLLIVIIGVYIASKKK